MSPIAHLIAASASGVLAGLLLAALPVWRLYRALRAAQHLAHHDDITGLPNRRALMAAVHRTIRDRKPFGVVLLDLDGFKAINDTFSHEAGNDVLADIGTRLAALPPPVLLAARLSGDEFALLVAGGPDETAVAAHAAWQAVGRLPVRLKGQTVAVRASVGHTTATVGVTPRTLLRDADLAMYEAKRTGSGVHGAPPSTAHTDVPPRTRCRDLRRTD